MRKMGEDEEIKGQKPCTIHVRETWRHGYNISKKPGGFRITIGVETRGVSRIHKILNSIRRQRMPELQTRQEASWFLKN
jgi:hypothetical protein